MSSLWVSIKYSNGETDFNILAVPPSIMELYKRGMKLHPQTQEKLDLINKTAMYLIGTGFREYKKIGCLFFGVT